MQAEIHFLSSKKFQSRSKLQTKMTVFCLKTTALSYVLEKGMNLIGRDRQVCKIALRENNCGRIHASIMVKEDECYLEISNGHTVYLNTNKIKVIGDTAFVHIYLKDGDLIKICNHEFSFEKYVPHLNDTDGEDTDLK